MACTEWLESREDRTSRIDLALRHMAASEGARMVLEDRPPRVHSLREIADFVGCDPTTILRIERRALATIREKRVSSKVG